MRPDSREVPTTDLGVCSDCGSSDSSPELPAPDPVGLSEAQMSDDER
jgi:hypothetical protein